MGDRPGVGRTASLELWSPCRCPHEVPMPLRRLGMLFGVYLRLPPVLCTSTMSTRLPQRLQLPPSALQNGYGYMVMCMVITVIGKLFWGEDFIHSQLLVLHGWKSSSPPADQPLFVPPLRHFSQPKALPAGGGRRPGSQPSSASAQTGRGLTGLSRSLK